MSILSKRVGTAVGTALFAVLLAVPVFAEQPAASHEEHHPGTSASPASPSPIGPGMKSGAMPMMDMCRQMMGDAMGMPSMMGGAPGDPKQTAAMLEMRGEMMKAMGDVMMKHARRMHGTTR